MKPGNNKIEFIYWFAYYDLASPSVRYRGKYALDYFRTQKGIESYFVVPGYTLPRNAVFVKAYVSALLFRKANSVIIIQRVQSNFIYANLLKLLIRIRNYDTVYDIDDADYLTAKPYSMYYFAKHCKAISAGSNQIKSHLSRFNYHILHTSSPIVDLGIYKTKKSPLFTIGWIGGFGGHHKVSLIQVVFPALLELTFPVKLVVLGVTKTIDAMFITNYFRDKPNIEIEIPAGINWNDEAGIQKRIVSFDVGIATLTNTEMQLSKSGIKAKQYMNNGVPVLSTNLPENNTVVIDGLNGYFCTTTNDFVERLNQFFDMSEADYRQFSIHARRSVRKFDHRNYLSHFNEIKMNLACQ